jgi:predicted nucleotidyltransferase
MNEEGALAEIVQTLTVDRSCHAVILYGSRARGDFQPTSDWDVAGAGNEAVAGSWMCQVDLLEATKQPLPRLHGALGDDSVIAGFLDELRDPHVGG